MRPNQQRLHPWPHQVDSRYYVLENPGHVYAVYFRGRTDVRQTTFAMDLPAGRWQAEWLHPGDGSIFRPEPFTHAGGSWLTSTPDFIEDIALKLTAVDGPAP
jgi:hypothetical protein